MPRRFKAALARLLPTSPEEWTRLLFFALVWEPFREWFYDKVLAYASGKAGPVREFVAEYLAPLAGNPLIWTIVLATIIILGLYIHSYIEEGKNKSGIRLSKPRLKSYPPLKIELTPSSGPSPDIRLAVKNLDSKARFWATCRILDTRNDPNISKTGTYKVPWKSADEYKLELSRGEPQELLIAKFQIWQQHDMGQIDILEWNKGAPKEFTGTRWNITTEDRQKPPPEFDLEISIFREGGDVPWTESFTLRPANPTGPLELLPMNPKKPTTDVWLKNAIHWATFGDWKPRVIDRMSEEEVDMVNATAKIFLKEAASGRMPVKGRTANSSDIKAIPKEYWTNAELNLTQLVSSDHARDLFTIDKRKIPQSVCFMELQTSRQAVKKLGRIPFARLA